MSYNAEHAKKYYLKNKEKIQAKAKEYYQNNKEKIIQNALKSYQKNKEKVIKRSIKVSTQKRHKRIEHEHKCKIKQFNKMSEQFIHKPVTNYENIYEIFENGMLWSWNEYEFVKGRINKDGYLGFYLRKQGAKPKYIRIHRLVALNFDERSEKELHNYDSHHMDLNKMNNNISNLVFLPKSIHSYIHVQFDQNTLKEIGKQVENLSGNEKTNKFISLINSR